MQKMYKESMEGKRKETNTGRILSEKLCMGMGVGGRSEGRNRK